MGNECERRTGAEEGAARRTGRRAGSDARDGGEGHLVGDDAAARGDGQRPGGGATDGRAQSSRDDRHRQGREAVCGVAGAAPSGRDAGPIFAVACGGGAPSSAGEDAGSRREWERAGLEGGAEGIDRSLEQSTMVGTSFGTVDKACPPIWLLFSRPHTHWQPASLGWGGQ